MLLQTCEQAMCALLQEAGSFHLRTTILPPEDQMPTLVQRFQKFHAKFMDQYR